MITAVGFRFVPHDQELILHYLYNRVIGKPFANGTVMNCDPYDGRSPCQIWEDVFGRDGLRNTQEETKGYFVTKLKKVSPDGKRFVRTAGKGSWQREDSGSKIMGVFQGRKQCVGYKKRFRFEKSETSDDGQWIMIEYSLNPSLLRGVKVVPEVSDVVLCKMKRNIKQKTKEEPVVQEKSQQGRKRNMVEVDSSEKTGNGSSAKKLHQENAVISEVSIPRSLQGPVMVGDMAERTGSSPQAFLQEDDAAVDDTFDDLEYITSLIDFDN